MTKVKSGGEGGEFACPLSAAAENLRRRTGDSLECGASVALSLPAPTIPTMMMMTMRRPMMRGAAMDSPHGSCRSDLSSGPSTSCGRASRTWGSHGARLYLTHTLRTIPPYWPDWVADAGLLSPPLTTTENCAFELTSTPLLLDDATTIFSRKSASREVQR